MAGSFHTIQSRYIVVKESDDIILGNQLSELSVINHVKCNSQLLLYEVAT